ncbi:MAG TPA: hypothetical protein VGG89_09325 [Candidatus Baltobacteraceae bacterium]|jgi:hypothetical protein
MTARRFLAMLALAALAACGSGGLTATSAPHAGTDANAPALTYGTYAWNVAEVTSRWKRGTLWTFAAAIHVNDFLLGFTDANIAKYSRKDGTAQMNAMIAEGKKHGVAFELLLGDPSWIVPSGVPKLVRILHRLAAVHFAGVNLDLEPNEVTGLPIRTVIMDLVDAMPRYLTASSWPVTLDANWIYMNDGNRFNGGICYPCGLEAASVKRIALLVYISDPKTVYAVCAPILKHYPNFSFTIGQSVEPPKVLPKRDSYWHDGFAAFYADMQRLDGNMHALRDYTGLTIESLQYLQTMPS